MSTMSRLNELYLKHDGKVPDDELKAALGDKAVNWAEARCEQHYFEERLMLNWVELEKETHPLQIKSRLEKHEYFIQQAKEWRAKANALDWQRQALAAE